MWNNNQSGFGNVNQGGFNQGGFGGQGGFAQNQTGFGNNDGFGDFNDHFGGNGGGNMFADLYQSKNLGFNMSNNVDWNPMGFDDFYDGDDDSEDSESDDDENIVNPFKQGGQTEDPEEEEEEAGFEEMDADELNNAMNDEKDIDLEEEEAVMFNTKNVDYKFERDQRDYLDQYDDEEDDTGLDQEGDDREWSNWVVDTFKPKRAVNVKAYQSGGYGGNMDQWKSMNRAVAFVADSDEYNNLKAQLQASGQKYTDSKFRPAFESIWGFGQDPHIPQSYMQQITWRRPEEVFNGPFTVFDDNINPNDIKQGILGDCYFLAAMAAVAEHQDRIKKLFLSRDVTETGCYCVALCLNGVWEEIILDDLIPCKPGGRDIAFNHTVNNELWAILLEKAWAKVHGGYLNIEGGLIKEALRDLTGAPCITYFSQAENPEIHWKRILDAEQNHWIMCAASGDIKKSGNDSRDDKTGLSGNHAYSLLAAYEIQGGHGGRRLVPRGEGNSNNTRIVKMRNPWGKGEWTGAWSDDDDARWTQEMRQLLGHMDVDDGVFFMPFEDFLRYFHDYQLCMYDDNAKYSSQKYATSTSRPTLIEFDVTKPGDYFISINQINTRFFRRTDRNFHF